MVKVEQTIRVYELDGKDVTIGEQVEIGINSHWNRDSIVEIRVGQHRYGVLASDVQTAIENATNTK